jgi:hypothetical protein
MAKKSNSNLHPEVADKFSYEGPLSINFKGLQVVVNDKLDLKQVQGLIANGFKGFKPKESK